MTRPPYALADGMLDARTPPGAPSRPVEKAHHRGQIPKKVEFGLWEWGKR